MLLQAAGDLARAEPLRGERLDRPDETHLGGESNRDQERLHALVELRLTGGEDARDVAIPPGVGEKPARRFTRGRDCDSLDLARSHRLAASPGRKLVDLACKHADVVADDLDEPWSRVLARLDAEAVELRSHPHGQIFWLRDVVTQNFALL